MIINSSGSLRERSKITLGGFKGLDTLNSSVEVSAIHSTEMQNLISRDGVNHKRYGWKTRTRLRHNSKFLPIRAIFSFTIYLQDFVFAYADKKFWWIKDGENIDITNKRIDSTNLAIEEKTEYRIEKLEDQECKCFVNGNKVYFVGCGDFLVFSKWSNDMFELRKVVGNEDVYIPTTTENIGSEEDGQHLERITAEERNILSPYSYNTLFGVNELPFKKDDNTYNSLNFYLDSKDFTDIEVKVETADGVVTLTKSGEDDGYKSGDRVKTTHFTINDWNSGIINSTISMVNPLTAHPYIFFIVSGYSSTQELLKFGEDKLYIKYQTKKLSETEHHEDITLKDGRKCKVYYRYPTEITANLYYKPRYEAEVLLQSKECYEITPNIDSISDNGDGTVLARQSLTINFGEFSCDLTSYNAIISEIVYNIDYLGSGAIGLAGGVDDKYKGNAYVSEGRLLLEKVEDKVDAYKPLVPDVPNIKVKLTRNNNSTVITKSSLACEFGTQGVADRLFVVDNAGNVVRWSKDEDFTYFGDKSFLTCGTADKKITGMDRLNDSTLLVVKEYSPREPALFVIQGKFSGEENNSIIDYKAIFNARGYQVGRGAVGELINFNGECLMVCEDGLYSVSVGENVAIDSRYVTQRSRQITNTLEKYDLSKAKCISFGGKFYVGVGNECYVADSKYMVTFAEGQSANYEWWKWTNLPINTWGVVGNELWFGTEDGQICSFTKNFFDETITMLDDKLINYKTENLDIIGFVISPDIKVSIGDKITPKSNFYGGIKVKVECVNGITKLFVPLDDYVNGETIYIDNDPYTIAKHDVYCSIEYNTDETELLIYKNYKDKELTIVNEDLALMDKLGNEPIWSRVSSNGGLNPLQPNFKAILSHKETVVAKWVSGAMDLGTRTYSKSLTFITLTGEKDLANRLKYGISTRFNHKDYELLRANNDLDFYGLDLQTISLDSQFASSFSKRLNVRNVNFVMFYFLSDTAEDIALNSVQIEFKIHKRNVGVK